MGLSRVFLGWGLPLAPSVRRYLVGEGKDGPVELEGTLVVVPTRQAGRHLREALAEGCGVLSLKVVTPSWFLLPEKTPLRLAGPETVKALWAMTLLETDPGDCAELYPAADVERNFAWALRQGEILEALRGDLLEGGLRTADMGRAAGRGPDGRRWEEIGRLEGRFLEKLEGLSLDDPLTFKRRWVEDPVLPPGVRRVVLAGTADPHPLALRALERTARHLPVEVLVHAPPDRAGDFDEWGRPLCDPWATAPIDVPGDERTVRLAASPLAQAQLAVDLLREELGPALQSDSSVGVPDRQVVPFLERELEAAGFSTFDPAGKSLSTHPLYRLLASVRDLVVEGSYRSLSALLRRADVLDELSRCRGVESERLLEALDMLQNRSMPETVEDVRAALRNAGGEGAGGRRSAALMEALAWVGETTEACRTGGFAAGVRAVLKRICGGRTLDPRLPSDGAFMAAAAAIDESLREHERGPLAGMDLSLQERFDLFLRVLEGAVVEGERSGGPVDLEGWLELPWSDAPVMVVTGFNEGKVPDSRPADPFLPDSLRRRLGLRGDLERTARDAFLATSLIESRRGRGRVYFVVGRTSVAGDPLMPSRLLFHCGEGRIADRARTLFGSPGETREKIPSTVSFRLRPLAALPAGLGASLTRRLGVTQLKDYLDCPFRFFLSHLLGMDRLDDRRRELDALDFGSLVHDALIAFSDERLRGCDDEEELRRALERRSERWVESRFRGRVPLTVEIQVAAAAERLAAAAGVQAALAKEGWEILRAETRAELVVEGVSISGRVDRVDRNLRTGEHRILDYKTSDRPENPEDVHCAVMRQGSEAFAAPSKKGRARRWTDLQLPLYRHGLAGEFTGEVSAGYFCLPKGAGETGLRLWKGFDDETVRSALECSREVITRIGSRLFWPPAPSREGEKFEDLFTAGPAEAFDPEGLRGEGDLC